MATTVSSVDISPMAATVNITIEQGATFRLPIIVSTRSGVTVTPVDLTDYAARMQIRMRYTDTTPILALDNALLGGITFTDAVAGEMQLVITDVQSAALTFRTAKYDLEVESLSGDTTRLMQGTVTLSKEVTR